jgi:hypothetical protein
MSWRPGTQVLAPSDAMMFAGLAGASWVQHAWSIIEGHVTHEARKPYFVRQNFFYDSRDTDCHAAPCLGPRLVKAGRPHVSLSISRPTAATYLYHYNTYRMGLSHPKYHACVYRYTSDLASSLYGYRKAAVQRPLATSAARVARNV